MRILLNAWVWSMMFPQLSSSPQIQNCPTCAASPCPDPALVVLEVTSHQCDRQKSKAMSGDIESWGMIRFHNTSPSGWLTAIKGHYWNTLESVKSGLGKLSIIAKCFRIFKISIKCSKKWSGAKNDLNVRKLTITNIQLPLQNWKRTVSRLVQVILIEVQRSEASTLGTFENETIMLGSFDQSTRRQKIPQRNEKQRPLFQSTVEFWLSLKVSLRIFKTQIMISSASESLLYTFHRIAFSGLNQVLFVNNLMGQRQMFVMYVINTYFDSAPSRVFSGAKEESAFHSVPIDQFPL